jgi:phenylpropionate dioxygenase-like ring-hydroxylating dioxygenase large terminal subunit
MPVATDRTLMRLWVCPSPFPSAVAPPWYDRLLDRFTNRVRDRVIRHYARKINAQDTAVCEKMQTIARQSDPGSILSPLEERIGWFEDAYAQAMKAPAAGGRAI